MKIPAQLTDEVFTNLVTPASHYNNADELVGRLTTLTNDLHASLHRGQNQITTEVLGVLAEIHAFTITSSRGYLFR